MTTVSASVVAGRDTSMVAAFLQSLWCDARRSNLTLRTTLIVNEGSGDAIDLGQAWGSVEVIRNDSPRGFAHNHNAAIARGVGDFHLLSNDDVIVRKGTIETLMRFMDAPDNARVGAVCPQLLNPDGTVQGSTYSFPSLGRAMLPAAGIRRTPVVDNAIRRSVAMLGPRARGRSVYGPHDETTLVDTVRGAFVLMRGATIADIGPMDEISLVGGEDLEWHRRMLDHGWRVAFFPGAAVVHRGRATRGDDPILHLEALKGLFNYFDKYGGRLHVPVLRFVLGVSSAIRLAWASLRRDATHADAARRGLALARTWPR